MFTEFFIVIITHFLALISPGPDFLLISRNSILYSKKTGILIAVGLGLGILVHVTYTLFGVTYIIKNTPVLFNFLKIVCSGYLLYLAFKILKPILFSKTPMEAKVEVDSPKKEVPQLDSFSAVRLGFLTNVTNPKVGIFFLTIFTQVVNTNTPEYIKIIYGIEMSLMTMVWFSVVSVFFSKKQFKEIYLKNEKKVETAFAIILILLAMKFIF